MKYARFEDDPTWQAAYDRYLNPDAETPVEKAMIRMRAAHDMYDVEVMYE